jgi:hypothetical protein
MQDPSQASRPDRLNRPRRRQNLPVDSVETEDGWKKVERKRWKGKREKKVGTRSAGGVPTWADIATRFFFDGRMKGREGRFFLSCFLFVSFVWGLNGEKENLGGLERWLKPRGQDSDFLCPA